MGAIDTYLETVHREFKYNATWPPGSLVELGDIGVLRNGAFVRTASLADKGFSFRRQKRDAPAMRFATEGSVEFTPSVSGQAIPEVSAIAKLDAGLMITFKQEWALVFVMDPAQDEQISDVDSLSEWMHSQFGKKLKADQVIVTHIRRARYGVIAMSSKSGAQVQLTTDVQLGPGNLNLADVKGKLNLVTSRDTEFVAVPRGRSGATPLYRLLHFDNPPAWKNLLFGVKPNSNVGMASMRVNVDVGLFPAPRAVRGRAAMTPR